MAAMYSAIASSGHVADDRDEVVSHAGGDARPLSRGRVSQARWPPARELRRETHFWRHNSPIRGDRVAHRVGSLGFALARWRVNYVAWFVLGRNHERDERHERVRLGCWRRAWRWAPKALTLVGRATSPGARHGLCAGWRCRVATWRRGRKGIGARSGNGYIHTLHAYTSVQYSKLAR